MNTENAADQLPEDVEVDPMAEYTQIEPVKWAVKSRFHDSIGYSDSYNWIIHVEWGGSLWGYAIRSIRGCLDHDGNWIHEPNPSSRDDDWLAEHRWKRLEDALNEALVAVERFSINGMTARDAAERCPRD